MENTAKDQNKNNEIIITDKKKKRNGGSLFSKHTHTHTHAPQTYRKEGHST
jgi:hypothetical protein